jgi:Na+-transporting methylmalonyl-CoA/oxaloacetate decarboxylase beta subunit
MTAFSNIIADPSFLIMYALAFVLLYLGIVKKYEPLLLVPIAFGVLLANFPGGEMGVIQADSQGMVTLANGSKANIWDSLLNISVNCSIIYCLAIFMITSSSSTASPELTKMAVMVPSNSARMAL